VRVGGAHADDGQEGGTKFRSQVMLGHAVLAQLARLPDRSSPDGRRAVDAGPGCSGLWRRGLGFLAAGYKPLDAVTAELSHVRSLVPG